MSFNVHPLSKRLLSTYDILMLHSGQIARSKTHQTSALGDFNGGGRETGHSQWGTFSQGDEIRGHSEWTKGGSLADGMAEMGRILREGIGQDHWAEKEERWAQRGRAEDSFGALGGLKQGSDRVWVRF